MELRQFIGNPIQALGTVPNVSLTPGPRSNHSTILPPVLVGWMVGPHSIYRWIRRLPTFPQLIQHKKCLTAWIKEAFSSTNFSLNTLWTNASKEQWVTFPSSIINLLGNKSTGTHLSNTFITSFWSHGFRMINVIYSRLNPLKHIIYPVIFA